MEWVGDKVHVSETYDPDAPRLITHVEMTPATIPENGMSDTIHHALARKDLLPREHIVDAGDVDAGKVLRSRQVHDVDLVGPVHADPNWQAREARGFEDKGVFPVDGGRTARTTLRTDHSGRGRAGLGGYPRSTAELERIVGPAQDALLAHSP